jgi:hypothetical protein
MVTSTARQLDPAAALTQLAQRSKLPIDDVVRLYELERQKLASDARVTTFLHVFAIRKVQEILSERHDDAVVTH